MGPFTREWLTYQGPHSEIKVILPPPEAISCYTSPVMGGSLLVLSPSGLVLTGLVFYSLTQVLWALSTVVSCPGHTVLPCLSTTFGSYNLYTSSSLIVFEPSGEGDIDAPFRVKHSTDTNYLVFYRLRVSMVSTVHCTKKCFFWWALRTALIYK